MVHLLLPLFIVIVLRHLCILISLCVVDLFLHFTFDEHILDLNYFLPSKVSNYIIYLIMFPKDILIP